MEVNLKRNPILAWLYQEFMLEYLRLGHMKLMHEKPDPSQSYFIPHHGILQTLNTTPKDKVVFNASQKNNKWAVS